MQETSLSVRFISILGVVPIIDIHKPTLGLKKKKKTWTDNSPIENNHFDIYLSNLHTWALGYAMVQPGCKYLGGASNQDIPTTRYCEQGRRSVFDMGGGDN